MIILELTEDKFGRAMKAISKIAEHTDCLRSLFEEMAEDSQYGDRYGNRYGDRYEKESRYERRRY